MDDEEEIENVLADVEDVVAGRIIDMEHAELMTPLTDACADLETELDAFNMTSSRNAIINRMTVAELQALIASMKSMADSIRVLKKSAID
jgi:hypothetical protein